MHYDRAQRSGRSLRQLAMALVAITVGLIGWLQFAWLSQLRDQELAGRQVALRVASSNFQERIARDFHILLDEAPSRQNPIYPDLLQEQVQWRPGSSRGELHQASGSSIIGRARLQQLLGSRLLQAAAEGTLSGRGLWLEPPALVECSGRCIAWLLDSTALAAGPLHQAAELLFADFGEELQLDIVSIEEDGRIRRLYPLQSAGPRPTDHDLAISLLMDLPIHGPPDYRWELRVGNAGSSLEQAVAAAHWRNVLLSAVVLALLLSGLFLIDRYSRNRAALAAQRILFVASASHELRTPLSVIGSAADNLAEAKVHDEQRVREYGALIRSEVGKLTAMVDNVLEFSQTTGKPREFVPVRLDRMLKEALALCQPSFGDREVIMDLVDEPPEVLGQPSGLHSILVNLLNNVGKYAEGEGAIRISLRVVKSGRRRALALAISNPLTDQSDADPERWFEPFQRGRAAEQRRVPGTGIGLSVARNIAQQHGGGLTVQYGTGTVRFTLYLPLGD